jgi:peptidoglycan/xylan/chitin deacetylase (PgdA/CDA1 family)
MKKFKKRWVLIPAIAIAVFAFLFTVFTVFFDQAVLVRKNTIYHKATKDKVVALTFDDGPSPIWTPQILAKLKDYGIKATFFMIGEHVQRYPEIARYVAEQGHEIGNHSFRHHIIFYYKPEELIEDIKHAEKIIRKATGKTTIYFRPPKAWLTAQEKVICSQLGYKIVLWTLNSKDWVGFDDQYIIKYILKNIRPGDIILFHDSGGLLSTEGGDRHETVNSLTKLIERLQKKGYRFVTITELLNTP